MVTSVPPSPPPAPFATEALLAALRAVLRPLARLAVAAGLPYARIDETIRQVLVDAAGAAHPDLPPNRRVSRISTTLGLNRREVTRLTRPEPDTDPPRPTPATRLFLKWRADPHLRGTAGGTDAAGAGRRLPRQGAAPSFESLAQSVTRDVHPRSLLDELVRLGLARHDAASDTVELVADAFVPRGDQARMLGFLGSNVGDHLDAAVANVLGGGREHFEQAVFADELSAQSVETIRASITRQWQVLREALVPELEALIEADRVAGRTQDRRLRVGLFSFTDRMKDPG